MNIQKMLEQWADLQKRADILRKEIEEYVLAHGESVVTDTAVAKYQKPRKRYNYEAAVQAANVPQDLIDLYTEPKVKWRELAIKLKLDAPYEEGEPSVKLEVKS